MGLRAQGGKTEVNDKAYFNSEQKWVATVPCEPEDTFSIQLVQFGEMP